MKYATLKPRSRPAQWCTGTDPLRRDNYYAYLKHRAQARYRKESYGLTFADWEQLWTPELQAQRGTTSESLCLRMLDPDLGWFLSNCDICTIGEHRRTRRTR